MGPRHDVNGPCSCGKCGGQLQVKLANGGKFPGHHYIHCTPCGYHFVFPKADVPNSATLSSPPVTQGNGPQARTIDCARQGCKRRGCTQCLRRMCKQCCIASQSGCSLRAHSYAQLSAREQGKLPEPPMVLQAPEFPLDPFLHSISLNQSYQAPQTHTLPSSSVPFNSGEAALATSLQSIATNLYPSTIDEDQSQYAAAIAASLGLPDAPPYQPEVSMSSHPSTLPDAISAASPGPSQPAVKSHPSTMPSKRVRTIPYHPPNIKQHLSEDWMRPPEDKTKTPKRVKINLDNRFSIVFWHEDGREPKVRAIHECPVWPKWILMDAMDICEELNIHATLLEFYDMRSCQWITCSLSYPHDVKKDGYLLLRLLKTSCLDLEKYIQQASTKAPHLRNNIAGERAGVRQKLQQRRVEPPRFLVNLSDDDTDEIVFVESPTRRLKRHAEDAVDLNRPSQRQRSELAGPSTPHSQPLSFTYHNTTSVPSSPPIMTMSPQPASPASLPEDIYVPEETRWPDGMYAIDMARGFHRLDQGGTSVLKARLFTVFGREIPISTYRDQRRRWKALTQRQRDELQAAGRVPAGLWSHVPKMKK